MFGRDREFAAGARLLTEFDRGAGCLVLEAEPGIGKTTVWREIVARARTRSTRVLACRPAEVEAKFSFAGLSDLLGDVDRNPGYSCIVLDLDEHTTISVLQSQ